MEIYAILAASFEDSRVKDQGGPRQFEVFVRLERRRDRRYLSHEEFCQVGICDVTGRDQQKFVRSVEQQKRVHEIRVLGYYYPQITGGQFVDLRVGGAIGIRQVQGVEEVQIRTGSVRLT